MRGHKQRQRGTGLNAAEKHKSDQAMRVTKNFAGSVGKGKFSLSPILTVEMSCPKHICISSTSEWTPLLLQQCTQLCPRSGQGTTISLLTFQSPPSQGLRVWPPSPSSAHHVLHLGQASLPAVVDEPQHDDDGTDGADDHQHHKELPIITARLVRVRLAACGS